MKTTTETFATAKADALAKIAAAPESFEGMNDDWETVTFETAGYKAELVPVIEAADTFIPAFTPSQNVCRAVTAKASNEAACWLESILN